MARSQHNILWLTVLVMGIGYGIAAVRPAMRRGILTLGILGKPAAFAVWTWAFVQGDATWIAALGGLCDLLWAAYFVVVLRRDARAT